MKSIYHYCSIDTLETILSSKTLRFTSLEGVDDEEEAEVFGLGKMGRIAFVSCWTDNPDELIPMWREYAPGAESVRIEISSGLFDGLSDLQAMSISNRLQEKNDIRIGPPYKPVSFPITYTKDPLLLNPRVLSTSQDTCKCGRTTTHFTMNTGYIGRFKSVAWSNQDEYRFELIALPMEFYRRYQSGEFFEKGISQEQMLKNEQQAMVDTQFKSSYIDYSIDLSIFMSKIITMSPYSTADDYSRVESIIKDFNLSSKLVHSELRIRK